MRSRGPLWHVAEGIAVPLLRHPLITEPNDALAAGDLAVGVHLAAAPLGDDVIAYRMTTVVAVPLAVCIRAVHTASSALVIGSLDPMLEEGETPRGLDDHGQITGRPAIRP